MADWETTMTEEKKTPAQKAREIQARKAKAKRAAKPHKTREGKTIITPLSQSTRTRETHPHLYHSTSRHGAAPKEWPRRRVFYIPCRKCNRIKTDTNSQTVVCYGADEVKVYLRCRMCWHKWTMPRAKRV